MKLADLQKPWASARDQACDSACQQNGLFVGAERSAARDTRPMYKCSTLTLFIFANSTWLWPGQICDFCWQWLNRPSARNNYADSRRYAEDSFASTQIGPHIRLLTNCQHQRIRGIHDSGTSNEKCCYGSPTKAETDKMPIDVPGAFTLSMCPGGGTYFARLRSAAGVHLSNPSGYQLGANVRTALRKHAKRPVF